MSAWVVSKTHIDLMVKAADAYSRRYGYTEFGWWRTDEKGEFAGWYRLGSSRDGGDIVEYVTWTEAGQMLVDECVKSVRYRYPSDEPSDLPGPTERYYLEPYVFEDPGYVLTPAEVFKAIDCYDYQSCEHPGWRQSSAYQFCESLRHAVCRGVEGYEDAPWGFDEVPSGATRRV